MKKSFIFSIITLFLFTLLLSIPNIVKADVGKPFSRISISFNTPVNKAPQNAGSVSVTAFDEFNKSYSLYFQELKWFKFDNGQQRYIQMTNPAETFNKNNRYAVSISYLITLEKSPKIDTDGTWTYGLNIDVNGKELDPLNQNIYTNGLRNGITSSWVNPDNGYSGYLIDTVFYELSANELIFEEVAEPTPQQPQTPTPTEQQTPTENNDKKEETENKKEYTVVEGKNETITRGEADTLSIRVDADIKKFKTVYLDNKEVDKKFYDLKEGSTIVIFKEEFIKSLSSGTHDLKVSFEDGYAISSILVENKLKETEKETDIEEDAKEEVIEGPIISGKAIVFGIVIVLMGFIALIAACIVMVKRKKKDNTNASINTNNNTDIL